MGDRSVHELTVDESGDVVIPGEKEAVSNFEFSENVLITCPVCGSQMKARLLDKGGNGVIGDVQITLFVTGRQCECPKVYLRYDD